AGPALRREALEQCRRHERQIAGEHDHAIVTGVEQRRVEAPERTPAGDRVGHDAGAEVRVACRVVGDDQDVVAHARERRELALDDAYAADDERRLVGAAEPRGAAPGENRGGDLQALYYE